MTGRILVTGLLGCAITMAPGQTPSTARGAAARPLAFDVVSIRLDLSGGVHDDFGPTPYGYQMINKPLVLAIITAYVPRSNGAALFTNNSVVGLPEWAQSDNYDIVAKVSASDLDAWRNPATQKTMLRAMLQATLADRCQLRVHREFKEQSVYSLVVNKSGPKLKPTDPSASHPGLKLPTGGVMVPENSGHSIHFYEASMATLASLLSGSAGRPVIDNTGLPGKYDFVFEKPQASSASDPSSQQAADPAPTLFSVVEALGLKLVLTKAPVETLVIDHIDPPSLN